MTKTASWPLRVFFLIVALFASMNVYGQSERQIPPPPPDVPNERQAAPTNGSANGSAAGGEYGTRFFDELRSIFGRFRDADLQRVFQSAQAIPCSQLVDDKGEWRAVAFFNDNRKLGDWYRDNLAEVKADLGVYIFKGACRGDRTSVQLTTKFPVMESLDEFNARKIPFDQIAINVNAPVSVLYDYTSEAYTFDLPYLFKVSEDNGQGIYSLTPQRLADRAHYAVDVTNHWDCKNVKASDVTYQFLICRTTMLSRDPAARRESVDTFGSSAYFILSDGKEAVSNVRFTFSDPTAEPPQPTNEPGAGVPPAGAAPEVRNDDRNIDRPPDTRPPDSRAPLGKDAWKTPDLRSRLEDVGNDDFRFRFNQQTWVGKIGSPEVLSDEKLSSLATRPAAGADYCVWHPGSVSTLDQLLAPDPDAFIEYSLKTKDGIGTSPASIAFDMKTHTGLHVGTLECFFPRALTVDSVTFGRWVAIVGGHLILEVPR